MADKVLKTVIQVRRDTAANWELNKATVPAAGEPCFETDTGILKMGDGVTAYESLPAIGAGAASSATHYEGVREGEETDDAVIERVLDGASPNKDDIFVIKTLISGENYSYKAYVYNGTAWAAMDGNYNAESVYFDEDLVTTSAIGNITLTNGQATIPSTGKNLKEVFNAHLRAGEEPDDHAAECEPNLRTGKELRGGYKHDAGILCVSERWCLPVRPRDRRYRDGVGSDGHCRAQRGYGIRLVRRGDCCG